MSRDIIFHIGYPKTATTFLQRGLFRQIPALGVKSSIIGADQLEFDVSRAVNFESMDVWASVTGHALINRIEYLADKINPIFYSSEYWLRGPIYSFPEGSQPVLPKQYIHLASDHLSGLRKYGWKNRGNVRALVTLRYQARWLGSQYAQISDRKVCADQEDFEDFVRIVMEDNSPRGRLFLDYYQLYEDLCSILGPDNVLILVFEEMGQSSFWNSLQRWTGYDFRTQMGHTDTRHNARGVECNKWRTRPSSWLIRSRPFEVLDFTANKMIGLSFKKPLKKVVKALSRQKIIELTPELAAYIHKHYRESNARLSKKLGLKLEQYGYC